MVSRHAPPKDSRLSALPAPANVYVLVDVPQRQLEDVNIKLLIAALSAVVLSVRTIFGIRICVETGFVSNKLTPVITVLLSLINRVDVLLESVMSLLDVQPFQTIQNVPLILPAVCVLFLRVVGMMEFVIIRVKYVQRLVSV
jgi:hypothetical protein